MDHPKTKIAIFLALTVLLSAVLWVPMIRSGNLGMGGGLYVLALMWCPGVAAILTRLVTQRNLRGEGWAIRDWRFVGLAYVLPLIYAAPVYFLSWGSGVGGFTAAHWGSFAFADTFSPLGQVAVLATLGMMVSLISATGEEIGWRGLLVPELAKVTSFRNVGLISAVVWASWHMPLIIGANYHGDGTPILFSVASFVAMVFAMSFLIAWVRLRSGSLWPAAMLHASHNLFVQSVFDSATVNRGVTYYLTGEFGAGLAVTIAIAAIILARRGAPGIAGQHREQLA